MDDTVAIAAVGAVVATSVTLIVTKLQKAKDARDEARALNEAKEAGYMKGWYEGREGLLQQFQPQTPQDFAPRT